MSFSLTKMNARGPEARACPQFSRRSPLNAPQSRWPSTLPLSKITQGYNPRRYFSRQKHDELVTSFTERGILQPILVRPEPDGSDNFQLVAGERRKRAATEVFGPDGEVPVYVREMTDQQALEAAIDENDNRDDASETEQADAAARHLVACHGDRAEAARRLGWSRAKLDRRLALADLSDVVKTALDERRIKVGHAELLAAVPADKQEKALDTILRSGLDVGKTRDLLMRVTQDLASASFDKSECTTCPFNSGTQRALFETHIEEGCCTNANCFQLKTETAEKARLEEQERAAEAARAAAPAAANDPADDLDDDEDDVEDADDGDAVDAADGTADQPDAPERSTAPSPAKVKSTTAPSTPAKPIAGASAAHKPTVTAKSIAGRTTDLREASWRTALARALAGNSADAQTTILVAAMSGTLSQIKPETLTSRAKLLVSPEFAALDYKSKIAEIRELSDSRAANVLSVIGAAYAKDVHDFRHVADLARTFDVDLRDTWRVDKAFFERFTKEELKFVGHECGLIAHMGEKAFAKLWASKKPDLIAGMLNATGFDWAGRLPSSMTLDCSYGPPAAQDAEPAPQDLAA